MRGTTRSGRGWKAAGLGLLVLSVLLGGSRDAWAADDITATFTVDDKVYDQTTAATVTGGFSLGPINPLFPDVFVDSYTATFSDKNVGPGKSVTVTITLGGTDAGNYTLLNAVDTAHTASITVAPLTPAIVAYDKVYDGTTTASVDWAPFGGLYAGDVVNLDSGTRLFPDKHVGTNKLVTVSGIFIASGADAGNYALTSTTATDFADITARPITVTGAANSKLYDNTTASATNPTVTLGAIQPGDSAGFTQTYDDEHVGTLKTMTPAGAVNDGNGGNNYSVTFVPANVGTITVRPISLTAATDSKTYDGTTSSVGLPTITSGSLAAGDVPFFTQTFDTKHVGTGKSLIPAGSVSDGNGGNNYAVTFLNDTTGAISPFPITVTAVTDNKVYDGTTSSVGDPQITVGALQPGDTDGFIQSFDTKHVGTNKTLTPSGIANDGNGGANYDVTFVNDLTGVVTVRTLNVSITANDKPYDGNANATFSFSDDRVVGDLFGLSYVSATFPNAYVGFGKTVTVTGIAITPGPDSGNYVLGNTSDTDLADITPILGVDPGDQVWDAVANAGSTLYSGATSYMIPVDVNGDDLMDVVNVTIRGAQVFRNDGVNAGHLTLTLIQEFKIEWSKAGGAIDIDADGDMDLVMGDVDDMVIALNDGTGTFVPTDVIHHGFNQPTVAVPFYSKSNPLAPGSEMRIVLAPSCDANVAHNYVGPDPNDHTPHVYVLHPDGLGGWEVLATLDSFNLDGASAHDLNGDGNNDLLLCNRSGVFTTSPIYLYQAGVATYSLVGGFTSAELAVSSFAYGYSFGPTDPVAETNFFANVEYTGLAVGTWHRVSVFSGQIGTFAAPYHVSFNATGGPTYPTGEVFGSAFADFDWDGVADLAAAGRSTPMMLVRLTGDPNSLANRVVYPFAGGSTFDLVVRDWDFDGNNAPDVLVGRSDGLWYFHNLNGGAPGAGIPAPPPAPPTAGEEFEAARDALYAALDPYAADPLGEDDPWHDNALISPVVLDGTYYDELLPHAGAALGYLQGIDPAFSQVPNVVFGATNADKVETLRNYWNKIGDALTELGFCAALTTDPDDLATITLIQNHLLAAQLDIVAQGQALGGVGAPFKRMTAATRALQKIRRQALEAQSQMQQAIAAARTTTDVATRNRLIAKATRQGRKSLNGVIQYLRTIDRGNRARR